MDNYEGFRLSFRLRSLLGTPWQADTLTGSLAWLVAFREGEKGIGDFLALFIAGKPPFVLSDGFPEGLLPRPLKEKEASLANDLAAYAREKKLRKSEYLRVAQFEALRCGKPISIDPVPSPWENVETLHAAISRTTGTTSGEAGTLFATESLGVRSEGEGRYAPNFDIYAICLQGWSGKLESLFRDLARVGFGRDKSVGLGQFDFAGMGHWEGFNHFDGANGFINLSTFVPAADDPTDGKWALSIKYGKLGENAGGGNPFKTPLLQIKPGGVFKTGAKPKPFYGRVVQGLAPGFPSALQICYGLAVPCKLN